jgi:hypothetical protein
MRCSSETFEKPGVQFVELLLGTTLPRRLAVPLPYPLRPTARAPVYVEWSVHGGV